jgi:hypothetical protein
MLPHGLADRHYKKCRRESMKAKVLKQFWLHGIVMFSSLFLLLHFLSMWKYRKFDTNDAQLLGKKMSEKTT